MNTFIRNTSLDSEFNKILSGYDGQFTSSLLLACRIYQTAPDHKLGTFINYKGIASNESINRALYYLDMTISFVMHDY
jgi:DNA polymerase-3 subunit epsilon